MKGIKIIMLDFDGTLGDTTGVIIKTTQATIKELGLPSRTDEQCAAMIGLRLVEIPPVLFPEYDIDVNLYAQTYRKNFNIFNTQGAVNLYPDVPETLSELKNRGLVLTIASSRSHHSLADYINNLDLSEYISYIIGGDDVSAGKPNPEAINRTLEKFGFKPEEAIMVGDTVFDVQMGINAGTYSCGVTYGNGTAESMSEATWLIDDFGKLLQIVSK
jgi:HAD superfamily hydrolase (TIGR01509 family)